MSPQPRAPAFVRPIRSDHAERIKGILAGMRDRWPSDITEEFLRLAAEIQTNYDALVFLKLVRWTLAKKLQPTDRERAYAERKAARRAARNRPPPNVGSV